MEQERSAHDVISCDVFRLLFFLLALSTWLNITGASTGRVLLQHMGEFFNSG